MCLGAGSTNRDMLYLQGRVTLPLRPPGSAALILEKVLCHVLIINRDAEGELLALYSNLSGLLSCDHADELCIWVGFCYNN